MSWVIFCQRKYRESCCVVLWEDVVFLLYSSLGQHLTFVFPFHISCTVLVEGTPWNFLVKRTKLCAHSLLLTKTHCGQLVCSWRLKKRGKSWSCRGPRSFLMSVHGCLILLPRLMWVKNISLVPTFRECEVEYYYNATEQVTGGLFFPLSGRQLWYMICEKPHPTCVRAGTRSVPTAL